MKQLFNRDWTQILQSMNHKKHSILWEKSIHQATELCIPSIVISTVNEQASPREGREKVSCVDTIPQYQEWSVLPRLYSHNRRGGA